MGQLRIVVLIAAATLTLMAPALVNGSPFIFYDTSHYLQLGRSIVDHTPLKMVLASEALQSAAVQPLAAVAHDDHASLSYAGGRSPYYSLFLYLAVRLGGLWTAAVIQCALAAWLVSLCLRTVTGRPTGWRLISVAGAMTLMSTAGFYACMLMPDIFAAFAIVCLFLATVGYKYLNRPELFGVILLGAFSTAAHSTIAPVLVAVGASIAMFLAFCCGKRSLRARPPWAAGSAILLGGLAIVSAFNQVSRLLLHDAPRSPPYLMARVLGDGYGRAYLARSCSRPSSFELCRFQDRTYRTHDEFMWSADPRRGVFTASDSPTRRKLQAEQMRFVLGVVTTYPAQELWISIRHVSGQIITFGLNMEFSQTALSWRSMSFEELIPREARIVKASRAYQGRFPFSAVDIIQASALVASIVFITWRLTRPDLVGELLASRSTGRMNMSGAFAALAIALLTALITNAIICGVFSGVNARYEARVIWLVPLLAIILWMACGYGEPSSIGSAGRWLQTLRRRASERPARSTQG